MASGPLKRRLVLENRLEEVSRCETIVLNHATEFGFTGSDRFAIKLALEEALANAIKHGNNHDPDKSVMVELHVDEICFEVSVTDEGEGFDPDDVPDPTLDENLEKPSGRGVMLMRTYMSEVSFNASGNCVRLVKRKSNDVQGA